MIQQKNRRAIIARAALAVFAGLAGSAEAGLTYDLRFSDGSHTQFANVGNYTLELWAQVSGTNTDHTDDSIVNMTVNTASLQINGGAVTSGGLQNGRLAAPFDWTGANGTSSDLNGDGLIDWGSTSTKIGDTGYMSGRAQVGIILGGGTVGHAVDSQTWEYKLATFTLGVTGVSSINGSETEFGVRKPPVPPTTVPLTILGVFYDDHSPYPQSVTPSYGYSGVYGVSGHSVRFITAPAPAWDGGASGDNSQWLDGANWANDAVPAADRRALIDASGSSSVIGIDFAGATNLGLGKHTIGTIELSRAAARDLTVSNFSADIAGALTINGVGGLLLSNETLGNTLALRNGSTAAMDVAIGKAGAIHVENPDATVRIDSTLNGSSSITKTGRGRLVLSAENPFSGDLIIGAGTVVLENSNALKNSTVMIDCFNGLDLNGVQTATLGGLSGGGALDVGSTDVVIGGNNGSTSYTGVISGNGSLTKVGNGTTSLRASTNNSNYPAVNNYTGGTTVRGGVLEGDPLYLQGLIDNQAVVRFTGASTFFGQITGPGSVQASGRPLFNSPQTYTGSTTVLSGGALTLGSSGTLASTSVNVSASSNFISIGSLPSSTVLRVDGTAFLNAATQQIGSITDSGAGTGALNLGSASAVLADSANYTGGISLGPTSTLSFGNGIISGTIRGTGSVQKTGIGTLTARGFFFNSSPTTVSGGQLLVGGGASGGTLGNVVLANGANITFDRSDRAIMPGAISGNGSLVKRGSEVLTLSAVNSYVGPTTIESGVVKLNTSTSAPSTPSLYYSFDGLKSGTNLGSAGTFADASASSAVVDHELRSKAIPLLTAGSNVTLNSGYSLGAAWTEAAWFNELYTSGIRSLSLTNNLRRPIEVSATNQLGLAENNVFTSSGFDMSTVSLGWHHIAAVGSAGNTSFYIDGALAGSVPVGVQNIVSRIGSLNSIAMPFAHYIDEVYGYSRSLSLQEIQQLYRATIPGNGSLPSGTALQLSSAGASLDLMDHNQTIGSLQGAAGSRVLLGSGTLTVGIDNTSTSFAGVVSGTGGTVKMGTGSLALSGTNTYSGSTTVNQGVLVLNAGLAGSGGTVRVNSPAEIRAGGDVQRPLAGNGTFTSLTALAVGDASSAIGFEFDGILNIGTQAITLQDVNRAKLGASTVLSAGGSITAAHGMTLNSGRTLSADGLATITGNFTNDGTVHGPAAADQLLLFAGTVDGIGSYTGNVEFSGAFNPGHSPAQVTLDNVVFDSTSTFTLEIGGTRPGIDYDQIILNGTAHFGGTLNIVFINGFTPSADQTFTLISGGTLSGVFDAITAPPELNFDAQHFYQTGSVPEPAMSVMFCTLGLSSMLNRRRRRD